MPTSRWPASSWLLREERLPSLKPPVEVLPTVTLTNAQVRWIFILTVLLLPGAVALHRTRRVAMAPALIRRWAWPAAAGLAFAFLVGLALQGGRPDIVVEFKPAGLMTLCAGAGARDRGRGGAPSVSVSCAMASAGTRRPRRRSGSRPACACCATPAPMRVLSAEEVARVPPSEYALGADSLRVTVRPATGAAFVIQFGGTNPLGSARYAKVEGEAGVALLPTYVAEAWEQVR